MQSLGSWALPRMLTAAFTYGAACGLIWFLMPWKAQAAGCLLGGLISLYNVYHLYFRMKVVSACFHSKRCVPAGLQMTVRLLTVVAGVLVVCRFPTRFDYHTFVLSLLFGYLLMVVVFSVYYLKRGNAAFSKEGGETLGSDSENTISRNDL